MFVDNEEGIWFGGVVKTKPGKILATQQMDKTSLAYTQHITRLTTSPPKKRGGGILPTASKYVKPIEIPDTPKTTSSQKNVWSIQRDSTIESKFADIQLQFDHQTENNIHFNARIASLENTTSVINNKMDGLLGFYEDRHSSWSKIPRINNNVHDMVTTPNHHHQHSTDQGTLYNNDH